MSILIKKALPLSVVALIASSVFAAPPPQPAIQACATLAKGATCSFQTPQGSTTGICAVVENQLACTPNAPATNVTTTDNTVESSIDEAWFDSSNSLAYLPTTDAGSLGTYDVVLALINYEPMIFELRETTPVPAADSYSASYNPDNQVLSIPVIRVGQERFTVELKMQASSKTMRFAITSLSSVQTDVPEQTDPPVQTESRQYTIVDTNQSVLYDDKGNLVDSIQNNEAFFGQDANYIGIPFNYTDNNDGTITDENTGLLWEKAHHATRLSYYDAKAVCEELELGGHTGWRLPNLKELFSLSDFKGNQHSGRYYLDNDYFDLAPPDAVDDDDQFSSHTVQMMGQTWSSTIYTGDHWNNPNIEAAFFFNFLDGHIKQAPTSGTELFYRCVYGDEYGANAFVINDNGTVTDQNTGLIWQQQDDGIGRNWQDSLAYCEDLELAGQTDWRLPNIKELQSIVDYTRHDPAIDPSVFTLSDSEGWFWSGTTHGDSTLAAAYICFGKCDSKDGIDTHGAGAQRADPKTGDPADYPEFGGAQDDDVRIYNYSRCVRDGIAEINFVTTDPDSAGNASSGGTIEIPQEAINACNGLSENTSCSIQAGNQTIVGSCSNLQGTLACKPNQ